MKYFSVYIVAIFFFAKASAQADSGYFKSFDGTKIYYEVKGGGEPIVLVHGFVVNGDWWKRIPLCNELLGAGYKVITMDMRGNGKSDKPQDAASYAGDAEARDIILLLDKLGIQSYKVIGYSRGSIITARLLLLDKRVKTAVLGGMGDGFTNPEWPRRILFYKGLSGEPVKEVEGLLKYIKEAGLDQQALALLQKEQPSASSNELGSIKQPVLLINGDKDPDNGSPEALQKMIPGAALKYVPGDHGTAPRSPAFAAAILEFIKK